MRFPYSIRRFLSGLAFGAGFAAATLPSGAFAAGPGRHPSAYDALAESPRRDAAPVPQGVRALVRSERPESLEERLGVPTFVWAASPGRPHARAAAPGRPADAVAAAREHLAGFAPLYRLDAADESTVRATRVHDTGKGAIVVSFQSFASGVEVFRDELKVVMNRDLQVVALSGYLPDADTVAASGAAFVLTPQAAVALATADLTGVTPGPRALRTADRVQGPYGFVECDPSSGVVFTRPARFKKVWFHLPGQLVPAYYVELEVASPADGPGASEGYSYVISAVDGRLLFRRDLTQYDSYTYRVWASASGFPMDGPQGTSPTPKDASVPDGWQATWVSPNDVTLQNYPFSRNDPWLPPGATETVGNNVDAFVDLFSPDLLGPVAAPADPATGDFRAQATVAGSSFLHTYDPTLAPTSAEQRQAAVQQLFFMNNFLHDWYYDSGFDEAAGNAQTDNFGRGGLGGDAIIAEGQDYAGTDNANMRTYADGNQVRMRMYVFTANAARYLDVAAPAPIAGKKYVGTAAFGPQAFSVSGDVVLVDDGSTAGTGGTKMDGCQTPFVNAAAVAGKIAFMDRGVCSFKTKAANAQGAGAIGVIIGNNQGGTVLIGMSDDAAVPTVITIPTLSITQNDGTAMKAQLTAPTTVTATLYREAGINRDGTIDNQIIAHEWGHYISNRLISNAAGLNNQQGGGRGEGWGDFHALLMTVREGDDAVASNATWNGVYALAGYTSGGSAPFGGGNDGWYYGIRRVPYSTDLTKDPLTFQHIQNGVALPAGVSYSFGANGANNAEVHNTGEVWASMLWECYAALLRDTQGATPRLTFQQAQDRMKAYLVAAYKATPPSPTLTEARDALLSVAFASDATDGTLFCSAFAKRGIGIGAVSPDRFSTTNVGVTESYVCGGALSPVSGSFTGDSVVSCDADGYLDRGETGRLTVVLKNTGSTSLSATTATVTSSNPNVSFSNGGAIAFPATAPFQTTSGTIDVTMDAGATGTQTVDLSLVANDTLSPLLVPMTTGTAYWGNVNDVPNASATDAVETQNTAWTLTAGTPAATTAWGRTTGTTSPLNHWWVGADLGVTEDKSIVSPVLNIGAGTFSFSFSHRFSFEYDASGYYDGGVLEISSDGGATWTDIGASATPGYNHTLINYSGDSNVLKGRPAFAGTSAAYPSFATVNVNLGTTYAGLNVQVRFRIGADAGGQAKGWEIDDIAFSGITNAPFTALGPQLCSSPVELILFDAE